MAGHGRKKDNKNKQLVVFSVVIFTIWIFWIIGIDEYFTKRDTLALLNNEDIKERVMLDLDKLTSSIYNRNCSHELCFNVYKCAESQENNILIYIYKNKLYVDENGNELLTPMSREYKSILDAIIHSKFYTPYPHLACIFIPSLDMLNLLNANLTVISKILESLPYWNGGKNHLLFTFLPGPQMFQYHENELQTGQAMIAAPGFSTWTFRKGFDISLMSYSPRLNTVSQARRYGKKRRWLLSSPDPYISHRFQSPVRIIAKKFPQVLILHWCDETEINDNSRCRGREEFSYPQVLYESTFCLIDGNFLTRPVIYDAAMAGCIPVLVGDSYILPLDEVLDWKRFSVQLYERELPDMMNILHQISDQRIREMQKSLNFVWESYFQNFNFTASSTIALLTSRIFPHVARTYNQWNEPKAPLSKPFFLPLITPKETGFTAVVLTFDRVGSLFQVIRTLGLVPSLAKVLVVWNNQHKQPPSASAWPKISKPLKVVQTRENKLSNRFFPYEEIDTEAIFALDDDIVMLTVDEIEFAFETWCEFPDRLVGFPSRLHLWNQEINGSHWKYESEWTNDISMVLTGAAFYHKYYSYSYTKTMPEEIKKWVDVHMNCEDIAMNFLIANATGQPPIKVTPRKKFKCPECTNQDISNDMGHMVERTTCINYFANVYSNMPLKSSEFRVDPVLYKDIIPQKFIKYRDVGAL